METRKQVAILIETSRAYGRGLLNGICQFQQQQHGKWLTFFKPAGLGDPPPAWLKKWKGDGVLVRIATPEMADAIGSLDMPVINLWNTRFGLDVPVLQIDNEQVATMAVDHLCERGIKQFGFIYADSWNVGFEQRRQYFVDQITKRGFPVESIRLNQQMKNVAALENERKRLSTWILEQPKPLGLLAMNDDVGIRVLEACRLVHVDVPDSVAVLGIDNDEYLCNLSIPPMSSIDVQGEHAGYLAATWLNDMMQGKTVSPPPPIKPRRVVTRQSTNILFSSDPLVGRALRLIWECASDEGCADRIFSQLKVSRALMNSRFKNTIGRTVHDQIRRVRVQKAMEWISNTNEPLKSVAVLCGFQTVQYFTRVFREMTGETPAAFRDERKSSAELTPHEQ